MPIKVLNSYQLNSIAFWLRFKLETFWLYLKLCLIKLDPDRYVSQCLKSGIWGISRWVTGWTEIWSKCIEMILESRRFKYDLGSAAGHWLNYVGTANVCTERGSNWWEPRWKICWSALVVVSWLIFVWYFRFCCRPRPSRPQITWLRREFRSHRWHEGPTVYLCTGHGCILTLASFISIISWELKRRWNPASFWPICALISSAVKPPTSRLVDHRVHRTSLAADVRQRFWIADHKSIRH